MIGRKSFILMASRYLTQIIGLIGVMILAKLWGSYAVDALGLIGFAMSFLALFGIIGDFGFAQAHVKRISEGKDLGACIGTYIAIKIFLISSMVTIIFIAMYIWKNLLNGGFSDATTESLIYVFILYYIFSNLSYIPIKTFFGKKQAVKQKIPGIFGRFIKVVLTIVVAFAGVTAFFKTQIIDWPIFLKPFQNFIASHAVGSLAMTYIIDMVIIFLVGMWFLRKYPIKKPSLEMAKSYFNYAMPVIILSVVSIISLNIDKIMIGYFWTSTEVGYYFTVQKITEFIIILSSSVAALLFPTISELHSLNNIKMLNKITILAERYISMIMIPPVFVIIIFVYPTIKIMLDKSFLAAAPVLIILTFYSFIYGIKVPYNSLINGINRPAIGAKIGLLICFVNIPLNLLFIPKNGLLSSFNLHGAQGAALATVISIIVGYIGIKIIANKLTGIRLFQSHTPKHIAAGIISAITLYILAYRTFLFPDIRWFHLIIFSFLGLILYIGILYIFKEFNKKDLYFFLNIIHPKKMLSYIKSELKNNKYD